MRRSSAVYEDVTIAPLEGRDCIFHWHPSVVKNMINLSQKLEYAVVARLVLGWGTRSNARETSCSHQKCATTHWQYCTQRRQRSAGCDSASHSFRAER